MEMQMEPVVNLQPDLAAKRKKNRLLTAEMLIPSMWQAVRMLNPSIMARNPVMFVTELGAILTTLATIAAAVSGSYEYITGEPTFQGQAAVEAKITDAASGEVLAEAVDRRMGGRALNSAANKWTDVDNILSYWAQQTRFRLCELQERTGCVRPQTGGL